MLRIIWLVLAVCLIVAKVFVIGPIAYWSWLWVLCPIWIPLVIALGIFLLVLVGVVSVAGIQAIADKG